MVGDMGEANRALKDAEPETFDLGENGVDGLELCDSCGVTFTKGELGGTTKDSWVWTRSFGSSFSLCLF